MKGGGGRDRAGPVQGVSAGGGARRVGGGERLLDRPASAGEAGVGGGERLLDRPASACSATQGKSRGIPSVGSWPAPLPVLPFTVPVNLARAETVLHDDTAGAWRSV